VSIVGDNRAPDALPSEDVIDILERNRLFWGNRFLLKSGGRYTGNKKSDNDQKNNTRKSKYANNCVSLLQVQSDVNI